MVACEIERSTELEQERWERWLFLPCAMIGMPMAFFGLDMYRTSRRLFGFTLVFFATQTFVRGVAGLPVWSNLLVALASASVVSQLTRRFYSVGILVLGFVTGGMAIFLVLFVGLYDTYCNEQSSPTFTVCIVAFSMASSALLGIMVRDKRLRRNLIIVETAFAGSFFVTMGLDEVIGAYHDDWDAWNFSRLGKADRLHCRCDIPNLALPLLGAMLTLQSFGVITQYKVTSLRRKFVKQNLTNINYVTEMYGAQV